MSLLFSCADRYRVVAGGLGGPEGVRIGEVADRGFETRHADPPAGPRPFHFPSFLTRIRLKIPIIPSFTHALLRLNNPPRTR